MSKRDFTGTPLTRYLFGLAYAKTIDVRQDSGQTWYVARDICNLLDIANPSVAVHAVRKNGPTIRAYERCKMSIHVGNYGKDKMLMVNAGGLLKLIHLGRTPFAEEVRARIDSIPKDLIPPQWHAYLEWEE